MQSVETVTRKDCLKVGGDLAVGSLLDQIVYWHRPGKNGQSKLRVERDGQQWVAKTREEWCEETGISPKQYRRAFGVLLERGLIESRIMRFKGQPMTHVRIRQDALMAAVELVSEPKGPGQVGPKGPSKWALSANSSEPFWPTPYTESTSGITTEITCIGDSTSLNAVRSDMDAAEILAKKLENRKKAATAAYGDVKKVNLILFWRRKVPLGDSLTLKEQGQLKKFEKGTPNAIQVVDFVVDNWLKFGVKVKADNGLTSFPGKPHIGFLLKYKATAAGMFVQSIAKPQIAPQPVIEAPAPAIKPKKEEPFIPTWEYANALLNGETPCKQ